MLNRAHLTVFCLLGALLLSSQVNTPTSPGTPTPGPSDPCFGPKGVCTGQAPLESNDPATAPPLQLEANLGQSDPRYSHLGRGRGFFAFLRGDEAAIDVRGGVLRAQMVGARGGHGEGVEAGIGRLNYMYGNDPDRWVTDVPTFKRVRFAGIYPGVDVVYYDRDGQLEHDFVVQPGADPRQIRMRFTGAEKMRQTGIGDLIFSIGGKELRWSAPVLYQGIRRVDGRYELRADGEVGFAVGAYDPRQPLVIDPVVSVLGYLGRTGAEAGGRSTVDAQGNIYLAGTTTDGTYPVTPGAVAPPTGGFNIANGVISKLSADGKQLIYSTYFGGANSEMVAGVAVDGQENAYVTGVTESLDFPTTAGSFRRAAPGTVQAGDAANCFVTKFNASGSAIAYSTYLGGTAKDGCTAIAVDAAGSAYVTGGTDSTDFPTTPDVFQSRFRLPAGPPGYDVFVTKLNPAGSALTFSTYVGGTGTDAGIGIAVDATGVYVAGVSNSSTNWPVTQGAAQTAFGGTAQNNLFYGVGDGFVFKLRPDGSGLIYNTLLGGRADDAVFGVSVDGQGNAYVAGNTMSSNFPVTASAAQRTWRGAGGEPILPAGDAFVTKINPTGTQFVYSTLLGGALDDRALNVAVAGDGTAWVVGHTHSTDFPVTADATQLRNRTGQETGEVKAGDGFVAQLSADGSRVAYATYLGGKSGDFLTGLSLLGNGSLVVSGTTDSDDLAVTGDPVQSQFYGELKTFIPLGDLFFARFNESTTPAPTVAAVVNAASYAGAGVSPSMIVTLAGTGIGPDNLAGAAVVNGALATTVSGTRVLFDGVAAPIVYVSARQSSVVVPYSVAGKGTVPMVVEYQGQRSAPLTVRVVETGPGLFSANASGTGPGAFLNQDGSVNTATNAAARGSVVILYATGEGQTDPPGQDGRLVGTTLPRPVAGVQVTIGGLRADVLYAGGAPGLTAGLLQLNVVVPPQVQTGNQPVVIRVGNNESQRGVTIAIRD